MEGTDSPSKRLREDMNQRHDDALTSSAIKGDAAISLLGLREQQL